MITGKRGRTFWRNTVFIGFGGILAVMAVAIGSIVVHPSVSASKGKTCLDCHKKMKDRLSKRHVHKPAKESCETCHKKHGFKQELILVKAMPELCTDCHEGVKKQLAAANVHKALSLGGCTFCHEPHATDGPGLLRTPEAASNVCLKCHGELSAVFASETAHRPFQKGDCAVCHAPHASERPHLLLADEKTLCLGCHKGAAEKHKIPAMADLACSDCHDPHAASKKTRLAAYSHSPFASGECGACHTVEASKIVIGDDFPPKDLCATCHDDVTKVVEGGESHFGAEPLKSKGTATCLGCHDPHKSGHHALLARAENDLCRKCHEDLPKRETFRGDIHKPYETGDCSACHNPHGGGGEHHFAKASGELCSACHADKTAPLREGEKRHQAFELIECVDCHSGHTSTNAPLLSKGLEETCEMCHEKERHAVVHPPYEMSSCGACHKNHAKQPGLLVSSLVNTCARCHGEQVKSISAAFPHPPAKEETCLLCHLPHGSKARGLLNEPQKDLCLTCHDLEELVVSKANGTGAKQEGKGASPLKLHSPVEDGRCAACHDPHGASSKKLLLREGEKLCYGCHAAEKVAFAEGNVHQPVKEGKCEGCHTPHGSVNSDLALLGEPGLCTRCHDFSQAPLKDSHDGFDVSAAKCTACHTPHSSPSKNLLNPVTHQPFAEGSCDACHEGGAQKGGAAMAAVAPDVCATCHDDKVAQKGHQHVKGMACANCHAPHASKFSALLDNPAKLCKSCHESVLHADVPQGGTLRLHKPIEEGSCLDCHRMHDPPAASFLAKSQQELCSSCHESIQKRAGHRTQHDPYEKGKCSSCHATHASSEPHLLKKDEQRLCKSCHGLTGEKMTAAHKKIPLTGEACTSCHDPHSTEAAKSALVYPKLHPPYKEGDCAVCHDNSGKATQAAATCLECHDRKDRFAAVHAGGRTGEHSGEVAACLDCHSPHAGYSRLFRRSDEAKTCLQCHDRKEFSRNKVHGALESGCTTCHDVHKNNFAELTGGGANETCAQCHEEAKKHVHPVGGQYTDPRTGRPLTCVSCHEPHSSNFEHMLAFDHRRDLCLQCHAGGTMGTR